MRKPPWLSNYMELLIRLRTALYKFEFMNEDINSFIRDINAALLSMNYTPLMFVISDAVAELFNAYAFYSPSKYRPRIIMSSELLNKPRIFVGRVIMHEVFHHVLFEKPPSLIFKLAPRKTLPLVLILTPIVALVVLAPIFNMLQLLPILVIASVTSTTALTIILLRAINTHELYANALMLYLITNEWIVDWKYYKDDEALMNVKWSSEAIPTEKPLLIKK